MSHNTETSKGWSLEVELSPSSWSVVNGVKRINEPSPTPVRAEVVELASEFVEKLNIGISDPGDATFEVNTKAADATHLALRQLLGSPASKNWRIKNGSGTVVDTFAGTLTAFPRNVQERQPVTGSMTISLDSLPTFS